MATSTQAVKESKKKSRHHVPSSSDVVIKSEVYLNRAFDGLNRCKSRTQSVPSELADIIAGTLKSGIKVYNQARLLHRTGKYQSAKKYAKAVCLLCTVLNNLAEEQTENILDLGLPPQMQIITSKVAPRSRNLHHSLNLLDSFIRQRMKQASKFYRGRLVGYSDVLSEVSKYLGQIEKYH